MLKLRKSGSSYVVHKPKCLTRAEVTTATSLTYWRRIYGDGVPFFREEKGVKEDDMTDDEIIRLLAEWNGSFDEAASKITPMKEFRKTYLPIPRSEVLPSMRTGKFVFHGHDRVGRPVVYYRVKLHQPKNFTPEQTLRHVIYEYEYLLAHGGATVTDEICVVIDRSDAKTSNMDIEFLKLFYKIVKDNYPARGELFLIFGTNWAFRKLWDTLIVHFLDTKSRSSTFMVKDKEELKDFIAEEQMADFVGGKLPYTFIPPSDDENQNS